MVPGGRPLIDTVYKYNELKVLYFIDTADSGSKSSGIPYLYKYPDLFYNAYILPVDHTLLKYKFFGSVNEV